MKINRLILKNFSSIKNAMNANEIEIDFTESVNKICLLIGPNGSGKTSILSMLHPFADVGNLDNRNGYNLILEGKDGYKEIEIQKNDDTYLIKHFYTPQKGKNHSVKSYIYKNGNDLNVNGNVTSFKEIVKMELQIEPDYLKLIRLGSNVTSMIDLSATERKNFMSKIMDDIGIYLEYYKAINQKIRDLDQLMSHTTDKINRLNIIDENEESNTILNLKKEIEDLEIKKEEVHKRQIQLEDVIESFGDSNEFFSNGNSLIKKYEKMTKVLEKKDEIETFEVSFYEEKIKTLSEKINSLQNEYNTNIILINNTLSHINDYNNQLHSLNIELSRETNNDKEIELMNENLKKTRLKLRELEENIGDFEPSITKQEFDSFYVFVKNMQKILSRTYEFGKKPIEKVVELMRNEKNVMNYINSHLIDIDENISDRTPLFLSAIKNRCTFLFDDKVTFACKDECVAKDLFIQLREIFKNSEVTDKNNDVSFYHDMEYVYGNLKSIIPQFYDYATIIDKLPDDIKSNFIIGNIYKKIENLEYIYDENKMNDYLSLITEYDNYKELLKDEKSQEEGISRFSSISKSRFLKDQIDNISETIDSEKSNMINLKNRNIEIDSLLKEYQYSLERYSDIKETIEEYDEVSKSYTKFIEDRKTYDESVNNKKYAYNEFLSLSMDIDNKRDKLQILISNLDQYKSLIKDKNKFSKIYDNMVLIKDALSSKTGIPLRIISSYLENTNQITNEFLNIVYDGKIYIDDFQITSTEFSIPFYNHGIRLADVKYASQGELSFLSIALSFALSSQVLSRYNIMLLDEIDGPLDTSNREKFIKILEAQIDRISSEQNFLITHNSMFSSYPVDILDLSFVDHTEDYPNASFIHIKRK